MALDNDPLANVAFGHIRLNCESAKEDWLKFDDERVKETPIQPG
jgi:hypothetical protein